MSRYFSGSLVRALCSRSALSLSSHWTSGALAGSARFSAQDSRNGTCVTVRLCSNRSTSFNAMACNQVLKFASRRNCRRWVNAARMDCWTTPPLPTHSTTFAGRNGSTTLGVAAPNPQMRQNVLARSDRSATPRFRLTGTLCVEPNQTTVLRTRNSIS